MRNRFVNILLCSFLILAMLVGCGNNAVVTAVQDQIDSPNEGASDGEDTVASVNTDNNTSADDQKNQDSNAEVNEQESKQEENNLNSGDAVDQLLEAYNALSDEDKARVSGMVAGSDSQNSVVDENDAQQNNTVKNNVNPDALTEADMEEIKEKYERGIIALRDAYKLRYGMLQPYGPDHYMFCFIDEDDFPELIVCNEECGHGILYDEVGKVFLMNETINKMYYVPKKDFVLTVVPAYLNGDKRQLIKTGYYYYKLHYRAYSDEPYVIGNLEKAYIKTDETGINLYEIDNKKNCTESEFMNFMNLHGELTEIILDYDHMYPTIDEAAEAFLNSQNEPQNEGDE